MVCIRSLEHHRNVLAQCSSTRSTTNEPRRQMGSQKLRNLVPGSRFAIAAGSAGSCCCFISPRIAFPIPSTSLPRLVFLPAQTWNSYQLSLLQLWRITIQDNLSRDGLATQQRSSKQALMRSPQRAMWLAQISAP